MKKVNGLVMKTSKKMTILYTDQGDYLKIKTPKSTPSIGQIIEVKQHARKPFNYDLLKYASIAAVFMLILSLSLLNIITVPHTAAAAVIMDINSSMEIQVDREAKVLNVKESTQDSKASSFDSQFQGMDLYEAVNLIIDEADKEEAFNQDKNLVLTSIIPLDKKNRDIIDPKKLRDSIERHMLNKGISADMMVTKLDETTLKTAQTLGMSTNQYLVYKRIQEQGLAISSNPTYNNTLSMLNEANTTLLSLFPSESVSVAPANSRHRSSNVIENPASDQSNMSSMHSGTDSNQVTPDKESTSSPYSMPESQHSNNGSAESMPMQDSSKNSGQNQMMPSSGSMEGK